VFDHGVHADKAPLSTLSLQKPFLRTYPLGEAGLPFDRKAATKPGLSRDEVLKRMLKMKPKPHKEDGSKTKGARKKATKLKKA
jgi:hypothetical protein